MSKKLRGFFHFHGGERPGILILLTLLLALVFYRSYLKEPFEMEPFSSNELDSIWAELDSIFIEKNQSLAQKKGSAESPVKLFRFNPNAIEEKEWMSLGFSQGQAESIIKYREAGAIFRVKADLMKLYVVSEDKFQELEPFIDLPDTIPLLLADKHERKSFNKKEIRINLNKSDTSDWKKIRGIGSAYANRIVKYRKALGGFYSKDQVREVYGINDSLFLLFEPYIIQDSIPLKKINLNSSSAKALKEHPYISWNLANALVAYREQHGPYKNIEDIKKLVLLEEDLFQKLRFYLTIEDLPL